MHSDYKTNILKWRSSFDDGNALFRFVGRAVNGVKGLTNSGITKVPERSIQPPKERINKLTAASGQQLAIDLSELRGPNHDNVANAITRAAETLGFLGFSGIYYLPEKNTTK